MRIIKKYKKIDLSISKVPLKILKFKRSKWVVLKKILQARKATFKKKKAKILVNIFLVEKKIKDWNRLQKYFHQKNYKKNIFMKNYDNSINYEYFFSKYKESLIRKEIVYNFLVLPEFKLDILLFNLNFFASCYAARQAIFNGQIFLNNKIVYSNTFLMKGDIIFYLTGDFKELLTYTNSTKKYLTNEKFFSFLEVDYYTKTIVMLKNYNELSLEDAQLLITEYTNIKNIE